MGSGLPGNAAKRGTLNVLQKKFRTASTFHRVFTVGRLALTQLLSEHL